MALRAAREPHLRQTRTLSPSLRKADMNPLRGAPDARRGDGENASKPHKQGLRSGSGRPARPRGLRGGLHESVKSGLKIRLGRALSIIVSEWAMPFSGSGIDSVGVTPLTTFCEAAQNISQAKCFPCAKHAEKADMKTALEPDRRD